MENQISLFTPVSLGCGPESADVLPVAGDAEQQLFGSGRTISLETAQKLKRMGLPQRQTRMMWSKQSRCTVYDHVPQGFGVTTVDAYDIEELRRLADRFSLIIRETDLNKYVEELCRCVKLKKQTFRYTFI